jgi:hypothetical protein
MLWRPRLDCRQLFSLSRPCWTNLLQLCSFPHCIRSRNRNWELGRNAQIVLPFGPRRIGSWIQSVKSQRNTYLSNHANLSGRVVQVQRFKATIGFSDMIWWWTWQLIYIITWSKPSMEIAFVSGMLVYAFTPLQCSQIRLCLDTKDFLKFSVNVSWWLALGGQTQS